MFNKNSIFKMSLSFDCGHKFEKNVTENGTPFYMANLSKEDETEDDKSDLSYLLNEHQKIPGILFYQSENKYFYLVRNDDAKIWGRGKGEVDVEKAQIFALLTKKNSKLLSLYSHIDDFWIKQTINSLKKIDCGRKVYAEIGNEIQEKNIQLFHLLTENGNQCVKFINQKNLPISDQTFYKEKIEKIIRLSMMQLEICQKLQVYKEQIELLCGECND